MFKIFNNENKKGRSRIYILSIFSKINPHQIAFSTKVLESYFMNPSKENEANETIDFDKIKENLNSKNFENIQKLEDIAKTVNAEKLFVSVIVAMCLVARRRNE